MDLAKYKEQLGEAGFNELTDYVQTLQNQKEEARKESISGRQALKSEVEQLRTLKADLFERLGIENVEELATLPDAKGQAEAQKQYEARIKRLEKELKASQDGYAGLEGKHKATLLDAQLTKAISAHEFVDTELVTDYIKSRVKFDDGEIHFIEGDKTLSLTEGVQLLAQTKPHLIKAQGTSGSGFNPNATSGKTKSFNEMSLDERQDVYRASPEQYKALKDAA